jgi:carbon-monoxide dehydrogenase medium subunit
MGICEFAYHRPTSIAEACDLARKLGSDAAFLAGGTELLPDFKRGADSRTHLIALRDVADLGGIRDEGDALRIGAMTRLEDIARSEEVRRVFPVLADAASVIGGVQIRHQGTIGGNFCRAVPCADTPPPCIVGGATLRLLSPDGERSVPAREFFVGPRLTVLEPGEILVEILIPAQPGRSGASFQRFSLRRGAGLAVASVAARIVLDGDAIGDTRIALGAVAPVPLTATKAAALLVGATTDEAPLEEVARVAAGEAQPITDLRGTESFRRELVESLTLRALRDAIDRARG